MSITLLCLVKGNTLANAFPVHIDGNSLVGDLKKVIKAENVQTFANVDAKDIKLWKVEIPGDHDDPLSNLSLQENDELLAINDIGDYWTEKPLKKHIHVLVESPVTTVTSSREQELLEEVASLQALLNKSVHGMYFLLYEVKNFRLRRTYLGFITAFDVIVNPKRTKSFKWTVNIEQATLEGLKNSIRKKYQLPSLENDGAVLTFIHDKDRYTPSDDTSFRDILQLFVSKKSLKFSVFIETPSKAFSDWTFPKVCQLYGLGESDDPSLSVFPPFTCEYKEMKEDSSQAILKHLISELNARLKSIPINGNEASKSQYVCSYLVAGVNLYEGKFELRPEKNITGPNGHGPVDFAIDLLQTAKTVGVTEVKDEDFFKGIAQNAVQLESALSNRKRKANEMEEGAFMGNVFGIVTDAEKWYFLECSLDDQERLRFKLSKPIVVVYDSEDMEGMVERVLGHIAWLLDEVQKPDSDSRSVEREIKRVRSSSNLIGKTN
jgi:hypothetical protein